MSYSYSQVVHYIQYKILGGRRAKLDKGDVDVLVLVLAIEVVCISPTAEHSLA